MGGPSLKAIAGSGVVSDLFTGLGDFASAKGYKKEAKAYGQAQLYAEQNAVIAQEAGAIKLDQTGRRIYRVLGAQQAEYAGAGLTGGGSAQEVMRSSISQGALDKAIVNEQTQINVTGYKEEAQQFAALKAGAQAAATAATASGIGNLISGGLGLAALF